MTFATGLDIGNHNVRAVVLERKGRGLRLKAFAEVSRTDSSGDPKPIAAVIAELDAKVGFKGQLVCSNSDMSVLVRFVSTLPLPPDRLARLLRLELSQHADASGDLAADTLVVPIPSDELLHCCILAQPAQVYSSLIDLRDAGVDEPLIHFAPAAAYNATLPMPLIHDADVALLVDVGSHTTGITLYGEDRMLACRQVPVGGNIFTEALIANGFERAAAEQSKRKGMDVGSAADEKTDEFSRMLDDSADGADAPATPPAPADPAVSPQTAEGKTEKIQPFSVLEDPDAKLSVELDDALPDLFAGGDTATPASQPGAPTPPKPSNERKASDSNELFVIEDHVSSNRLPPVVASAPATPPAMQAQPGASASVPPPAAPRRPASPGGDGGLDPAMTRSAEALFGQIVSSLTWFKAQLKLRSLEPKQITLAGGGAGLPGLAAYISRRFSAAAQFIDPFAGFEEGGPRPEHAHEWTTAVGLALAAPALKQRSAVRIDLRPETLIKRALWKSRLIWPYVAAACLVVATVFAMMTLHSTYSSEQASLDVYDKYQKDYAGQKKQLDQLDQDKKNLQTDLRAIASRVYAGRDVLYALVAIKQRTRESPQLWLTGMSTHDIGEDSDVVAERRRQGGHVADASTDHTHTIERGAVDIAGKVKIDSSKLSAEREDFLGKWRHYIRYYTPPNAPPLFHEGFETGNLQKTDTDHGKDDNEDLNKGEFIWSARFLFQPTDLSQVTATTVMPPDAGHAGH
jgi:Tfp pilus assembly PilM family ATPase